MLPTDATDETADATDATDAADATDDATEVYVEVYVEFRGVPPDSGTFRVFKTVRGVGRAAVYSRKYQAGSTEFSV